MVVKLKYILLIVTCFVSLIYSQDPGSEGPTLHIDPSCGGSCEAQTFPSIKAGLDALPPEGGTLVLGEGTYVGADNKNLVIVTPLTIKSENEDPGTTIVDCEGDGYGFKADGQSILFDGFTITNCRSDNGAALNVNNGVNTTLIKMIFAGNIATANGGAVWQNAGLLNVFDTQFNGNDAILGSAVYVTAVNAIFTATVFNDNNIDDGTVVGCSGASTITFQGGSSINNEDFADLASVLCADCTVMVDTQNYCENVTPEIPITPPITAPPPVEQPPPPPPVEQPPPPPPPVQEPTPMPPPPPPPPSFGAPPPTESPQFAPQVVPIFNGPSFGSSATSLLISSAVVIGCSFILTVF